MDNFSCMTEDKSSSKYKRNGVYDPKIDIIFKKIFEDKKVLLSFINDVTGIGATEVVGYNAQEITDVNRSIRLDISIILESGELVNIEMQNSSQDAYLDRALYYISKVYSSQSTGTYFEDLSPVIGIHVVNSNMKEFEDRLLTTFSFISDTGNNTINKAKLYFINLKSKIDNSKDISPWKSFFNNFDKGEIFMNSRLEEVYNILENMSLTLAERTAYESELKKLRDEANNAHYWDKVSKKFEEKERKIEEKERKFEEKERKFEERKREVEERKREVEERKREVEERKREVEERKREIDKEKNQVLRSTYLTEINVIEVHLSVGRSITDILFERENFHINNGSINIWNIIKPKILENFK